MCIRDRDRPVCMYIVPNITTVRIPRMRFGGEAVDMLINKVLKQPYDDEKSTVKTAISLAVSYTHLDVYKRQVQYKPKDSPMLILEVNE